MSTCIRLGSETPGSWPIVPKIHYSLDSGVRGDQPMTQILISWLCMTVHKFPASNDVWSFLPRERWSTWTRWIATGTLRNRGWWANLITLPSSNFNLLHADWSLTWQRWQLRHGHNNNKRHAIRWDSIMCAEFRHHSRFHTQQNLEVYVIL